jgi:hypothetical protein
MHSREWSKRNPEKVRAKWRQHWQKKHYGISPADYDRMLLQQGGVCAICKGLTTDGRRLFVDHNHESKRVRGLLCNQCNTALGMLRERVDLFLAAIAYLKKENEAK